jgi:hypothetical protein
MCGIAGFVAGPARLVQETWNFKAFLFPPRPAAALDSFTRLLPAPATLADFLATVPDYRLQLRKLARQIAGGQIPLLGTSVFFSPAINSPEDWRRDLVNGQISGTGYFRRLPYLDAARVGDRKVIWELNRHQHLVLLAQAALVDPCAPDWIPALSLHLDSWFEANPFHRGMNWVSAPEVAFRALSWVWILNFAGDRLPQSTTQRILLGLYQHAEHLAHNLSIYSAPNTDLIGEALSLYILGRTLPQLPESARWRESGSMWLERLMLPDGAHFEPSSYHHLYAVDFFLCYAALAEVTDAYRDRLRGMCVLLATITDRDGSLPLLGDDDGGRFFHPFGRRRMFARATLTGASFFFDEPSWRFSPADYAEIALWIIGPPLSGFADAPSAAFIPAS